MCLRCQPEVEARHVGTRVASSVQCCSQGVSMIYVDVVLCIVRRYGLSGPLREKQPSKQLVPANQRSHVRLVCGPGLRYAIRQIPLMGRSVGRRMPPIDFPTFGRKTSFRKVACSQSAAIQLTEPEGLSSLMRGSPKATSVSYFTQMHTVSKTRLQSVPDIFLYSTATS